MEAVCCLLKNHCAFYHFYDRKIYLTPLDSPILEEKETKVVEKILQIYFPTAIGKLIDEYFNDLVFCFDESTDEFLADLPGYRSEVISLCVSPNNRYVCVTKKQGLTGYVIDTLTRRKVGKFHRGIYQAQHTSFSVTLIELQGKTKLVYSSDWNILQLWDVETWQQERSLNMGDYFNSTLTPSPDSKWIINSGWHWNPYGAPRLLSVEKWLESSSSTERKEEIISDLEICDLENTENSACWIDNNRYAVLDTLHSDLPSEVKNWQEEWGEIKDGIFIPRVNIYQTTEYVKSIVLVEFSWKSNFKLFWDEKTKLLLLFDDQERKLFSLDLDTEKIEMLEKNIIIVATHPTQGIVIFDGDKFTTLHVPQPFSHHA